MERTVYRPLFSRLKNDREMRQCNDQVLALSKTAKEIYEYTDSRTQEIGHMHLTGHEVAYCRICQIGFFEKADADKHLKTKRHTDNTRNRPLLKQHQDMKNLVLLTREDILSMTREPFKCPYCRAQNKDRQASEMHVQRCGDYFDGHKVARIPKVI